MMTMSNSKGSSKLVTGVRDELVKEEIEIKAIDKSKTGINVPAFEENVLATKGRE